MTRVGTCLFSYNNHKIPLSGGHSWVENQIMRMNPSSSGCWERGKQVSKAERRARIMVGPPAGMNMTCKQCGFF